MRYITLVVLAGCLCVTVGCGEEPMYSGKPLSHWLAQSRDKDEAFRAEAIDSLAAMSSESSKAKHAVFSALRDESPAVRVSAVKAFHQKGLESEALSQIVPSLDDENMQVRKAAVKVLGALEPAPIEACEPLAALLTDSNTELHDDLIQIFKKMGADARPALPEMQRLLSSYRLSEKETQRDIDAIQKLVRFQESVSANAGTIEGLTGRRLPSSPYERQTRLGDSRQSLEYAQLNLARVRVRSEQLESAIAHIEGD